MEHTRIGLCAAAAVLAAAAAMVGFRPGGLTGEEVLGNVEKQVERVNDYTVALDIVVDVERMKVPPMHAMIYY